MNRNLWGVENFEEITIRHSKFAAQRFAHEAAPALTSFANSSPAPFIAGIKAARERIVARSDEDRESFLRKRGFSKSETAKIIETVLSEEHRKPESIGVHGVDLFETLDGRAVALISAFDDGADRAQGEAHLLGDGAQGHTPLQQRRPRPLAFATSDSDPYENFRARKILYEKPYCVMLRTSRSMKKFAGNANSHIPYPSWSINVQRAI
jgi:hypothetical protein